MSSLKIFFALSIFIFTGCQNITDAQKNSGLLSENESEIKAQTQTPEQKAVRLAEDFIKRNGYTNEPADKDNLSYESIEKSANTDKLLKSRKNSLESKAFAILPNKKGWTVVFRYNKNYLDEIYQKDSVDKYDTLGRAVTMDKNFENLRVEHKSILLKNLKKL